MINRVVDIRRGEVGRAVLAFFILLLVVGSYTVVKSVRDAVFLKDFGLTDLSLIAIGLAMLTNLVVSLYLRSTAGIPRNLLIGGTDVVVAASLFAIWVLLGGSGGRTWVPWVLYIWSSVFGVFTVMQFWLLANDLFDSREAKRLFGFVGAGAILGGITGGFLSRWLAAVLGARGLLLVSAGMYLGAGALANVVWPLRRQEKLPVARNKSAAARKKSGGFAVVRDNPYVRLIGTALLLSVIATTLLDWQFKAIVKDHFAGDDRGMAAYFGTLYGWLSVASFVLQAVVTAWLLRTFGVGVGLMMLPVSLLFGSAGILFYPLLPFSRLGAASGAKVAEGGLRFAIDKASMELMWLPVPPRLKERGKAFVDTVVDRFGTGTTGLLWLALAGAGIATADRVHFISIVVIAAVVLWITVLRRARAGYVDAFRETLASRSLDLEQLTMGLMDAGAKQSVQRALDSDDPREVRFALYLLGEMRGELPDLAHVLTHEDDGVRCDALKLLTERRDLGQRRAAVACLTDAEPLVREAAVLYLRSTAPAGPDPVVDQLSGSGKADFAVAVIRLASAAQAMPAAEAIRQALAGASGADRVAMVRLLGGAPPEMAAALLAPLLGEGQPEVVAAALRAAGRSRAAGLVPGLSRLLADRRWRPRASAALKEIGAPALPHLQGLLRAADTPLEARIAIVRLLGASGAAEVGPQLVAALRDPEQRLSLQALRALVRLRGVTQVEVDQGEVIELTRGALEQVCRELLTVGLGAWPVARFASRPEDLLRRTLLERSDTLLARIFGLLSLLHDAGDMRAAFDGLRSPLKSVRAGSIEFLDNVISKEVKLLLLPLLEDADAAQFAAVSQRIFAVEGEARVETVRRLLTGDDPWLRAVACWTAGAEELAELRPELERVAARSSGDAPAVARRSLQRLDGKMTETPMGMTVVEKALKLQTVDVLQSASSEDLAHVAQIAEEVEFPADASIYAEGDAPDALFVVISGSVKLHRGTDEIGTVEAGDAFGTWALLDEAPRVASATATAATTLLKVDREEFLELLADRVDIVQAVLKAMVARLRQLADVVKGGA